MKTELFTVVVLYNQTVSESLTCKNLKEITDHKIQVVIVDNSTRPMGNDQESANNNWMYISMNGNAGLSKAYNKVLNALQKESGIIVWLDDDTNISQEYFDVLDEIATKRPEIDIFAPVIYGQDGKIYSPNEARFFKNKQLKTTTDELNMKKFNAINSCTAVRLHVYENYNYNEAIFLDQVDHNFFEEQRILQRNFYKMDVVIHHNFSLKSKMSTPKEVMVRYKIMIPDYLIFCSKSKTRLMLGMVKVLGWGVREAKNYMYPPFIWWCFREGILAIKSKKLLA